MYLLSQIKCSFLKIDIFTYFRFTHFHLPPHATCYRSAADLKQQQQTKHSLNAGAVVFVSLKLMVHTTYTILTLLIPLLVQTRMLED